MSSSVIGPVRCDPELREQIDIMLAVRNLTLQEYVVEALRAQVTRDRGGQYELAFQSLTELRRIAREEAELQNKSA